MAVVTSPSSEQSVMVQTPRGEFHLRCFGGIDNANNGDTLSSSSAALPVFFFVHGAGMSSMCFRLVSELLAGTTAAASTATTAPTGGSGAAIATRRPEKMSPASFHQSLVPPPLPPPSSSSPPSASPSVVPGGAQNLINRSSSAELYRIRCCSIDLRCHGQSHRRGGEEALSLEVLVADTTAVITAAMEQLYPSVPRFYLGGHSLGGAVAAHTAHVKAIQPRIAGLVVMDVVEGTAKQSLAYMKQFLEKRPSSFPRPAAAVSWFLAHGGMRSPESAAQTVPTLLHKITTDDGSSVDGDDSSWGWITDLGATMVHWDGWFNTLDRTFVSAPCPKMLCLAGTDRLDKELTIGQMQGKFQLEVMMDVGHYLMEDDAPCLAAKLRRFVKRIETLSRNLPPPPPHHQQ